MDTKIIAVVLRVIYPDGVKWDVADDNIKELVGVVRCFKACDLDVCFRIEISCNIAGNRFYLHPVQPGIFHAFRQDGEKISGSHRGV